MDYPKKMTMTRQEMSDLNLPGSGGVVKVVSDAIIAWGQWSAHHELIFRLPGMPDDLAYVTFYSENATVLHAESPWEYADAVCVLVRAVPVTKMAWMYVGDEETP